MRYPKSPSYTETGKTKPRKEGRNKNTQLPIRYIVCSKCRRLGGTLILVKKRYYHQECRT